MALILVVDDERPVLDVFRRALVAAAHECVCAAKAEEAIAACHTQAPDLAVVDWKLPGHDGIALFRDLVVKRPAVRGILVTAYELAHHDIHRALWVGFDAFLHKPVDVDDLVRTAADVLAREAANGQRLARSAHPSRRLVIQPANTDPLAQMIGTSQAMQRVRDHIRAVAAYDYPVHLWGETGTGKELAARAIHAHSGRARRPFVPINCPSVPGTLFEAECLGHERGAYTDAHDRHRGWFEQANGGSVFLDEVGDLPLEMQAKLLRILEDRWLIRLGGRDRIPIDVRLITATNIDLKKAVEEGRFRRDLFHRLTAFTIELPPVRDRGEDAGLLIDHFVNRFRVELGMPSAALSADARARLAAYRWPGNVREIQHTLLQAIVLARGLVEPAHLPVELGGAATVTGAAALEPQDDEPLEAFLTRARQVLEQRCIDRALAACRGNRTRAAARLGIDRKSLFKKMRRLGIG